MYHISHTISDEYNKRERTQLVTSKDEITKINDMSVKCNRVFSDERTEKQNKSIIWSNEAQNRDYKQENGSPLLKGESKETFDPLKLKMQEKPTDPNKPLTTSKEHSHYSEFVTKLDYLVGKVIELATSSGDVSVKNSEVTRNVTRNMSSSSVKSKTPPPQKNNGSGNITHDDNGRFEEPLPIHKQYSNCIHFGQKHTLNLEDANPTDNHIGKVSKLDPQYLTYRMANNTCPLLGPTVPPILNDSIKYVRVSSKDLNKSEYSIFSLKRDLDPILSKKQAPFNGLIRNHENDSYKLRGHLSHDVISESLKFDSYIQPIDTVNGAELETYRILVSGHLTTTRETPVFIVHKNYIGSSTLIKDSLDFRAHEKRGNVDISLAGKFFHNNILIENDKGYPSALDLKSHKLLIDRNSAVIQESFKQIFNLGLFDAILEGEFVANSDTLQYIPIFSLEVVKHKSSVEVNFDKATTVIETDDKKLINSLRSNTKESITGEQENTNLPHSPQTSTQEDNLIHASNNMKPKNIKIKPNKSKFTKFKESIFLKFSFLKNKGNSSNDPQDAQPPQNTSGVRKSNKKEKCSKKIEETKLEEDKKPNKIATIEICEVSINNDSCSSPRRNHIEEIIATEKKPTKKKHSKRSKIVENPGVTQMQGFFFHT